MKNEGVARLHSFVSLSEILIARQLRLNLYACSLPGNWAQPQFVLLAPAGIPSKILGSSQLKGVHIKT